VKWHFVELLQQLFLENFARPIYEWCNESGLLLTGHVLHEDSLTSQVAMQGSLARFYEYMHYPGVDVLTEGNRAYWIVKQLSSAARQLGQRWLLSELYGCTGWQMSFESHKAVGDWQALFGINLRCHHLSWYTMQGEAKRDYPASILHQSAWWPDYHHVETYFARLGRVLSQGEPCCDVLVLSPVESVWCQVHVGWAEGLSPVSPPIQELERAYAELFFHLAGAQIDFDYADEEMLGRLGAVERDADGSAALRVGQARYRAVVLGKMTTVRSTTLALLGRFVDAGGAVVFTGDPPPYVDALPSMRAEALAGRATRLPGDGAALRRAVAPLVREPVEIVDPATGAPLERVFCQLRTDGERRYLVALNVDPKRGVPAALVRMKGAGPVAEWSCLCGMRWAVEARTYDAWLEWTTDFPPSGERVFVIGPDAHEGTDARPRLREVSRISLSGPFDYALGEPNVCVLDVARWRVDGGPWEPPVEVLKVDQRVRARFGLAARGGEMVQPWFRDKFLPAPEPKGAVTLAFEFTVDALPSEAIHLCVERPGDFAITVNGAPIPLETEDGWWVDVAFRRLPIPPELLRPGPNEVVLETRFHEGIEFEALYLVGWFGVRVDGPRATIHELPKTLRPADLVGQGLPFYTGSVTYRVPVPPAAAGRGVRVELPSFEGACAKVRGPDGPDELIAWQPYHANLTLPADARAVEIEVVLTRRNTFGPLHQVPLRAGAYGPGSFTTEGAGFSESYMLYPSGLLAPLVLVLTQPERTMAADDGGEP
jgi:hypothetical protein